MQVADVDLMLVADDLHDAHEYSEFVFALDLQFGNPRFGLLVELEQRFDQSAGFLEILLDIILGLGGDGNLHPLGFGLLLLGSENLHLVATLEDIAERACMSIDVGSDAMFA